MELSNAVIVVDSYSGPLASMLIEFLAKSCRKLYLAKEIGEIDKYDDKTKYKNVVYLPEDKYYKEHGEVQEDVDILISKAGPKSSLRKPINSISFKELDSVVNTYITNVTLNLSTLKPKKFLMITGSLDNPKENCNFNAAIIGFYSIFIESIQREGANAVHIQLEKQERHKSEVKEMLYTILKAMEVEGMGLEDIKMSEKIKGLAMYSTGVVVEKAGNLASGSMDFISNLTTRTRDDDDMSPSAIQRALGRVQEFFMSLGIYRGNGSESTPLVSQATRQPNYSEGPSGSNTGMQNQGNTAEGIKQK